MEPTPCPPSGRATSSGSTSSRRRDPEAPARTRSGLAVRGARAAGGVAATIPDDADTPRGCSARGAGGLGRGAVGPESAATRGGDPQRATRCPVAAHGGRERWSRWSRWGCRPVGCLDDLDPDRSKTLYVVPGSRAVHRRWRRAPARAPAATRRDPRRGAGSARPGERRGAEGGRGGGPACPGDTRPGPQAARSARKPRGEKSLRKSGSKTCTEVNRLSTIALVLPGP